MMLIKAMKVFTPWLQCKKLSMCPISLSTLPPQAHTYTHTHSYTVLHTKKTLV